MSHVDEQVVRKVIDDIEQHFRGVKPTIGKEHDYLGMKIKFSDDRKVSIDMRDQIREILSDFPEEIKGGASTPAAKYLMMTSEDSELLNDRQRDVFHSTTTKLLYLEKRARLDIETAAAYLTTQVNNPDVDDWKKLLRVLSYLSNTIDVIRVIGCKDLSHIFTWVDTAFAVHPNMRSHTGGAMSLGWGVIHSKSSKQKLNTKSSTETELVGVSEYLPYNIWLINFLKYQGVVIKQNVTYQDNQSAILMEKNGCNSCTGNSRHIDIRYFFIKDRVDKKEVSIEYCPTHSMLADFFTKSLQGALFRKYKDV